MLMPKLGRKKAHRTHMFRNLAASLILYESVETTEAKAKAVKSLVDKSITMAKKNSLAARRQLLADYFDDNVVRKLFEVLVVRYAQRTSGYSRILKTGNRRGDGAPRSMVTLIPELKKAEPVAKVKAKPNEESTPAVEVANA